MTGILRALRREARTFETRKFIRKMEIRTLQFSHHDDISIDNRFNDKTEFFKVKY